MRANKTTINIIKNNTASFDVDCQNCFTPLCPEELPVPEGDQIVSALNAQATCARVRIGSKDAHSPKAIWVADENHPQLSTIAGENVDIRWVRHAVPGEIGFESIAGLPRVTAYDYFVWKGIELDLHPYGACYHDHDEKLSTGVIEFLNANRIDTVIVGGLATELCVSATALQLANANFRVVLNLEACRGLVQSHIDNSLSALRKVGVYIISTLSELDVSL